MDGGERDRRGEESTKNKWIRENVERIKVMWFEVSSVHESVF